MQAQAQQLERLASDLHAVGFDFAKPARSTDFAERRIAEVERIGRLHLLGVHADGGHTLGAEDDDHTDHLSAAAARPAFGQ